jgi:adenine phosphoribosyltransferase
VSNSLQAAEALIRVVPDFPKPGIVFKDVTPMLKDAEAFASVVEAIAGLSENYDVVAGIEARGFILAAAVAAYAGKGFVPIRKAGKLPYITHSESYGLEYGSDTLEIHIDAVFDGERVLLLDDVLATGGTAAAAARLIGRCGGVIDALAVLLEIPGLAGKEKFLGEFSDVPVHTVFPE